MRWKCIKNTLVRKKGVDEKDNLPMVATRMVIVDSCDIGIHRKMMMTKLNDR